jgi:hypothetical protein
MIRKVIHTASRIDSCPGKTSLLRQKKPTSKSSARMRTSLAGRISPHLMVSLLVWAAPRQVLAASSTGVTNSFTIAGEVACNPDLIPAGVNALLAETDRLKTKYEPQP